GRPRSLGVVVVIEIERCGDVIAGEQPRRHTGILAKDAVDTAQHREPAQCDIAEITDRGRHQIETRGDRSLGHRGRVGFTRGRRLGSQRPPSYLPEIALAAPVSRPVCFTRCRPRATRARRLRGPDGTGAALRPATALWARNAGGTAARGAGAFVTRSRSWAGQ